MPKYQLISDDGETMGFVVIKAQECTTLQNTYTPNYLPEQTWFMFLVMLMATTGILSFVAQFNGAISATVGLLVASILTGIRSWRGHILPLQDSDNTLKIEAEFTDPLNKVMYRDEIDNPNLDTDSLIRLCQAIKSNDLEWVGRFKANIVANVGRTQHTIIRQEFIKNKYLTENNRMLLRGRLFVGQVVI